MSAERATYLDSPAIVGRSAFFDAIHLATAAALVSDLARVCTYDDRMASAATGLGMTVVAPR